MVTDGTFSITKAAKPTRIICGTLVNDGMLRHVLGAKKHIHEPFRPVSRNLGLILN